MDGFTFFAETPFSAVKLPRRRFKFGGDSHCAVAVIWYSAENLFAIRESPFQGMDHQHLEVQVEEL